MAHDPSYESGLIGALEPGQLTASTERPLPRRELGRGVFTC
jgi:hypothetical protein